MQFMPQLYDYAKLEYLRCCRMPLGSWERHYNQSYLAFLRDFIAVMENRDQEAVQNEYEAKANEP
jgi:hypothetical protein